MASNAQLPILQKNVIGFNPAPNTQLGLFNSSPSFSNPYYDCAIDSQLVVCNAVNNSYKDGVLIKDLGYSAVGATVQAGKIITGLHQFRQSASIIKTLATVNNSAGTNLTLKYNNAGTWTDIVLTNAWDTFEDSLVEMEDFLGYCFFVGYDSTDNVFLPTGTLTNTTFSTTAQCTGMAQGKYIKKYRSRLYVANCYYGAAAQPYRVYFSSVPSAGSITWNVSGLDYFDVDYGDEITGLYSIWDKLIIFTQNKAYGYDQNSTVQFLDKGCISHRTIAAFNRYMIWADKDNVYMTSSIGDDPKPIGNEIMQLIRNSNNPTGMTATRIDDEYSLFLGATSTNGIAYTNCVATFNLRTLSWRWRNTFDPPAVLTKVTTSGRDYLYFGTTDGNVMVKSKFTDTTPVYSDAGAPIVSSWELLASDLGNPQSNKTIYKITTYSENPNGMHILMRMIDTNSRIDSPFIDLGVVTQVTQDFDLLQLFPELPFEGNYIQIAGSEMSSNSSYSFNGYTVLYQETTPNN